MAAYVAETGERLFVKDILGVMYQYCASFLARRKGCQKKGVYCVVGIYSLLAVSLS